MITKSRLIWNVLLASVLGVVVFGLSQNDNTASLQAGDTRVDEFGIEQVWVPAGVFRMGTDEPILTPPPWANRELFSEQPQHEVTLTKGFWIDKYEVSNAAFEAFVEDGGYDNESLWSEKGWAWKLVNRVNGQPFECVEEIADHPRVCVTWYEAEAYAAWRGGRLPTEAEWEFTARGPESLIFPWGNEWNSELANIVGSVETVPIDSYPDGVSWVGAYNLSGNAMEWVQDWWDVQYYRTNDNWVDPTGPERTGGRKVEKGGWWGSVAYVGRAAYRHFEDPPEYQDHHIGFRIATDQE